MADTLLYNAVDAAFPGHALPPLTDILMGYVGAKDLPGPPDTPHIWTKDEWNLYLDPASALYGGPQLRPLPIYTHDFAGDPAQDAENAVDAAVDLGWANTLGRLMLWDAEMLVDKLYTARLNVEVRVRGFRLTKYGSLTTIEQDPPTDGGTIFAAWQKTKPQAIPPGLGVGWQWASPDQVGGFWDLSICSPFVYHNCGFGLRKPEP